MGSDMHFSLITCIYFNITKKDNEGVCKLMCNGGVFHLEVAVNKHCDLVYIYRGTIGNPDSF